MDIEAKIARLVRKTSSTLPKDPLVTIDKSTARLLFNEMVENTKDYLTEFFK